MYRSPLVLVFFLMCVCSLAQSQQVTVVEYHPAPGQFVNVLPEYSEGMTHNQMCERATEALQNEGLVHLGTFGGYVTVKFDHPIANKRGSDVRIMGNSYYAQNDPVYGKETLGGSFEPGIVYVGVGEDVATCQWYELAGSEYYTNEQHSFTVTYYKPEAETGAHALPFSSYDQYLRWDATWTDADGATRDSSGYHMKVASHQQSFWPAWEQEEQLTFTSGRLPDNAIDHSTNGTMWTLYRYAKDAYGYVDASLNNDIYSTFDIDWAVDSQGKHVDLEEIHYIRVVSGLFQHCGWIGESSTEVSGFQDLHLIKGYDDNPIIIPTRPLPSGIDSHTQSSVSDDCYDLAGRMVSRPGKGIYIRNGKKFVLN